MVDTKVYDAVLEEELDIEGRRCAESCRGAINTAACTKLEFKVMNSMVNLDNKNKQEMKWYLLRESFQPSSSFARRIGCIQVS